jgi:hypothetical protein
VKVTHDRVHGQRMLFAPEAEAPGIYNLKALRADGRRGPPLLA